MMSFSWKGTHSQSYLELYDEWMRMHIALATAASWDRNMDRSHLWAASGR